MGPRFFAVRLAAISYPLTAIRCLDAHGRHASLSFRGSEAESRNLPAKKFPVSKKHNGAMTNRKPFANSFLPVRNTVVPCRVGNYPQIVSCRNETQCCYAE